MKIFMRNIGMTLHVIHKLRAQGIDNVKVNMDWQHLIMNGENLAEYAALLAAEGLLGHQHANSGWGTFDDDNMVGATAFMETLELALELRRANYGANGERLGFDLYPYTEDAVGAVKRSVLQWNFIDGVAAKIDEPLRCARHSRTKDACPRRTSSCTRRSAPERWTREDVLVGIDVGTTGVKGVAISPSGDVLATAEEGYPLSTPAARVVRAGPRGLVARGAGRARAAARPGRSASRARCTASSRSTREQRVLRPAILWNDQRTARGVRRDRGARRARAADRADRATARSPASPRRSSSGCARTSRTSTTGSRTSCCRRTTSACGSRASSRSTPPTRRERSSSTSANRRWSDEVLDALDIPREWLPRVVRVDRDRRRGRPGRGRARRRHRRARAAVGRARHVGRRLRRAAGAIGADDRGAPAHVLPCGAGDVARDGRDALGGRLAALAARRRRRRRTTSCWRRPQRWPAGREGLLFLPYLTGERTPHADPDARGGVRRASRCATIAARLVRAVLEGVAYGLRDSLELLRELGFEPEVGRVSGGGARSELWCRIVATRARAAARADGGRRGRRLRRGAARRRPRRASTPTRTRLWPQRVRVTARDRAGGILAGDICERLPELPLALPHPPADFELMIGVCRSH